MVDVAAARHDHVHAAQHPRDGRVVGPLLQVGDEDDARDAAFEQAVDLALHGGGGGGQVGGHAHVARAGDAGQRGRGRAHDAEARARGLVRHDQGAAHEAAIRHGRLEQPIGVEQRGEARLLGEIEVGAEEGLVAEGFDEEAREIGRRVELVVAEDVGVVGDEALPGGVEEGVALHAAAHEGGAGERGVARVDVEDGVAGGARLRQLPLDDRLVGGDAPHGHLDRGIAGPDDVDARQQRGVAVVVVQQGERHLAVAFLGGGIGEAAQREREHRRQRKRGDGGKEAETGARRHGKPRAAGVAAGGVYARARHW